MSEPVVSNPSTLQVGGCMHSENPVSDIKFHRSGQYLISSSGHSIILTDSLSGREKKRINAKSNGVGKIAYTHHESCILVSSEKKQNDIRYLCLHDNRYLRAFEGHNSKVTSLSMCPTDDHFLSASSGSEQHKEKMVLMWDLAVANPVAKLALPSYTDNVRVAYDDSGLIFGVMSSYDNNMSHSIKLYDARNYDKGPFQDIAPAPAVVAASHSYSHMVDTAFHRAYYYYKLANMNTSQAGLNPTFNLPILPSAMSSGISQQLRVHNNPQKPVVWNDFEFSNEGSHILVNTAVPASSSSGDKNLLGDDYLPVSASFAMIIDGFKNDVEPTIILRPKKVGTENPTTNKPHSISGKHHHKADPNSLTTYGACFSPDAKHVLVSDENNCINVYEKFDNDTEGSSTIAGDAASATVTCVKKQSLAGHLSPVSVVRCNPKFDVVASGCTGGTTALWIHGSGGNRQ